MLLRTVYVCLLLCGSAWQCAAFESENLDGIQQQVRQHLQQTYTSGMGEQIEAVKIRVNNLDPRLKLRQCDEPLTLEISDNGEPGGNVTVKTRCPGTSPWTVFVPARVDILAPVAVATRSLARGAVLQAADISLLPRNTAALGSGYITDLEQILGKELKRHLNHGAVVRLSNLKAPRAVKRGDALRVEATSGSLLIVAPGIALADGKVGQQIRVRNTDSKRIIKARVVAPGRVEVIL